MVFIWGPGIILSILLSIGLTILVNAILRRSN